MATFCITTRLSRLARQLNNSSSCFRNISVIESSPPSPHVCFICQRNYATQDPEDKVKPPLRPYRYGLDKLVKFVTTSGDKLEKRIPSVFQVYRTFSSGIKSFVADTKDYHRVSLSLWRGESLQQFSRRDLELYRQFSADLPLVGLMMVIAFAPGGAFVFPLAYVFPRFLLSHHFWTADQRVQFRRIKMGKKLRHYDNVLDFLHLLSRHIESDGRERNMKQLIRKLDMSVTLTPTEILSQLPLFEGKPYRMDSLSIRHMRHLSKANGMSLRRRKLVKDGLMLHYMDKAMIREGIEDLPDEELDQACAWRGLNPDGLKRKEKLSYLKDWIHISSHVHEPSISLLLHLPVLLGYCHPTNRELMGPMSARQKERI
ncbi:LETM1 domain-containing protein 1 [Aplysia californica]|uniref:LETM1 domain-containing protein 1 n=1 Tax=Aplysia californica TaxID=6500 RepID=A0ABM0K0T1_APLCA|nr:LETM1 domain-containing protein 1 [Aplysia californica]